MTRRIALITGASTGIGRELARQLARRGYDLALLARRRPLLEELAKELAGSGQRIGIYAADVTDWEQIKGAVAQVEAELGPIDMLIANAGVAIDSPVRSYDVQRAREVYEVNVIGLMQTVAAVLPSMIARRSGQIVGLSSLASYVSIPRSYAYCASKAAVSAHLEGLRLELIPYGIKVATVCPGFIRTPMTASNKYKMPFLMDVEEAVSYMIPRIEKGQDRINFPRPLYHCIQLLNVLPEKLRRRVLGGLKPPRRASV